MCLGKVFLNTEGNEPVMQDIARLRIQEGQAEMETLSGENRVMLGRIVEIDFLTSKIILDVTMNKFNII